MELSIPLNVLYSGKDSSDNLDVLQAKKKVSFKDCLLKCYLGNQTWFFFLLKQIFEPFFFLRVD